MKNTEKTTPAAHGTSKIFDCIGGIIDKAKVSFIGSVDENGFPNMKAMLAPRKRNSIKEFWFTTNTSSMRAAQYQKNSKQMIWQDGDTMYYKNGVTDPDYCVLKFTASSGRYYHAFKSDNFEI
jgi:general stress protein 26